MPFVFVIVGGVAGGASAAVRARRLDETAHIVLIERGPDPSFANCGMPYFIGGVIPDRSKLLLTPVERLEQRFNLDVRTSTEVLSIDRVRKVVRVRTIGTGAECEIAYDALLLAPGATPIVPAWRGVDQFADRVVTLRSLQDADKIVARLSDAAVSRCVLIGAGFIGLELCENLVARRATLAVSIVELADQVLPPFDTEMTTPISAALRQHGVTLLLGETTVAFEPVPDNAAAVRVLLQSGRSVDAELVIVGVGVRPDNKLALDAGLAIGPRGGVRINERCQTSDESIYAAGDVVETTDIVLGTPTQVPLGGPANRQGHVAASSIFGKNAPSTFRGVQGTAILGVFGQVAACTGSSEKTLVRAGRAHQALWIHPSDHASYFPGATPLAIKVLFEPSTGLVLGAQAVGTQGVDKFIDIMAVAIQAKMTVADLESLELAYAPQFGSAKSAPNMVGFVGAGILRGEHPQISVKALLALTPRPLVLDVRTKSEVDKGAIPGSVHIPVDTLRTRLAELPPKDQAIVVYCQSGYRAYVATRILMQAGFSARNLSGGWKTWALFHPSP